MRALLLRGVIAASLVVPGQAIAGPAGPDLKAVERGFARGMESFQRDDYPGAIKTWLAAAALLPETVEHRGNRVALYELVAQAYQKEMAQVKGDAAASEATAREALATLNAYMQGFTAAYPSEPLPLPVTEVQAQAREVVAAAEAAKPKDDETPAPEEDEPEPVQTKPWKPLAIGGGVALAGGVAMLAVFGVGLARAKEFEGQFDDPANMCALGALDGACADIDRQGRSGNKLATVGLVTAPILIGVGAALLAVAFKRRSAGTRSMAPVWSPAMAGVVFQQRF